MYKKRGITPIIAIVLLLMMTIAAFGLAYVWLTSFQKQTQSEVEAVVLEQLSQLGTQLEVLTVYEEDTTGNTVILIYNKGKNYIPSNLLTPGTVIVTIDGKPINPSDIIITPSDTDIAPQTSFEITLDGYNFNNFKDSKIHNIRITISDLEITYPCGPIPSGSPAESC